MAILFAENSILKNPSTTHGFSFWVFEMIDESEIVNLHESGTLIILNMMMFY